MRRSLLMGFLDPTFVKARVQISLEDFFQCSRHCSKIGPEEKVAVTLYEKRKSKFCKVALLSM